MKKIYKLMALVPGTVLWALSTTPALAQQCPNPPLTPPVVDGKLDLVYSQGGFRTDYIADVSGATASLHQIDDVCIDPNFIYLVWDIDLAFVDNSYGTNRNKGENFPWPKGHTFFDLAESDGQRLQILNVCGEDVIDIFMDFLDGPIGGGPNYATPSFYGVDPFSTESVRFLINGGDWTDLVYETSMTYNLNQLGFCSGGSCNASPPGDGTDLLVDSPPWANENSFLPASPYGGWIYKHFYEMRIERSVFATPACLQGTPAIIRTDPVELHASPSKIGVSPVSLVRGPSTIGDYVWLDADRDGIQDAGEPGLANVTLALYFDAEVDIPIIDGFLDMDRNGVIDANDDGTIQERSIIDGRVDANKDGVINTSDDGSIGLFTVIDGLIDVDGDGTAGETNGDDDGILPDVADGRFEPDIPVIDGGLDMDLDGDVDADDDGLLFGFTVIDGLLDLDGDGIAGETNGDDDGVLNTITVINGRLDIDGDADVDAADDGLFGNIDGSPGPTTVTDSTGLYTFTQLGAGTYFVDVTDDNGILSNFTLTVGPQSETDPSGLIELQIEDDYLLADFGYAPSDLTKAVVGNYVWSDADQDGIQEIGESGIGGVTLNLVDNDTMTVIATTTTAADGSYYFFGVDPGDYYVDVTDTNTVLTGYTLSVGPQSETDPSAAFHVNAGDVYLNADFGYHNPNLGAIGDRIWFDVDENKTFNTGEPGLGNVTVALIRDTDGDGVRDPGELIIATAVTNLTGIYTFPGLVLDDGGGDGDADYLAVVTDTRNVLGNYLEAIFLPLGSTANNTSKFQPYAAAISAGTPVNNTADFGYLLDNALALLGDRVWYDKDADGVQDVDEPGIENVRVLLYNDFNKNGVIDPDKDKVIGVRRTDVNGNYFFQRLHFDNNGEGYIAVVSQFARYDIINGQLDLNNNGVIDAGDDGVVDMITVIDGRLDLDADGVIETNGDDSGFRSGLRIEHGYIDFDRDGDANETNGDDSRFGPLKNYIQTGDPDQLGVPCTVCDGRGVRTLSTTTRITLTVDFGYDSVGTLFIGDTVYHDLDGDGMQDVGEPGLQAVTLDLYRDLDGDGVLDFDEPVIAQATTDANGMYLFDGLISDDYIVFVSDNNSILVGYTQTQGAPFEPVDSTELSTLDKDFGFVRNKPASISNFVWEDLDGDGVQDAGEPGIRNVTVNLYNPGPDGMPGGGDDVLVKTTTTSAIGEYVFMVQPGNYFVEIIRPSGYAITLRNIGTIDLDSDPDRVSGQAAVTTLIIGENDPTWDAGLYRPVAVGDRVWLDVDGDGVQDVGEPGIANVTLELLVGAAVVGTAITDSFGNYIFDQRIPETYSVNVIDSTVPAGLTLSGGTDPSSSSTLLSGQIVLTKDFGYTDNGTALIGDFVWSDADGDGIQDPGEAGIGGVTVDLIGAGPDGIFGTGDDVVVATTTTAADGSYYFGGLAAGTYRVDVTDTGGVLTGYTLSVGPQTATDPSAPITVAAGDVYLDADFGYFQAGLGAIGDRVWFDADNDGFRDAGEPGLGGVSVSLVQDTNGDGVWDPDGADNIPGTADDEPFIATTFTAADGTYGFSGLSLDDGGGDGDADYLVVVTDVDGVLTGMTKTSGAAGVDDNSQAVPYPVSLSAGTPTDNTADFGFNAPGVIGDRIWSDADGDGIQDAGEPGIGGVTVELRDAGTGAVIDTTTTAADGSYLFTLLLPGSYRVVVTDTGAVLTGYTQTGDPDEAGTCSVCDGESTTTLASGQSDLTRDFGYRNPVLFDISGTVFEDADRDGFHDDPPETGFPSVTLALWHDVDGNGVLDPAVDEQVATTITDGAGNYIFPDLPDDDYIVAVTDRSGILTGYELTSGLDQIPVELMGMDVMDVDFGYVRDPAIGAIGDTVWLDVDPPGPAGPDGVRGPTEAGISGVTLLLYRDLDGDGVAEPGGDDGAAIATTVTDANGNYLFDGLAAGDYFVDVDQTTLPAGLVTTVGTIDPSAVIPLAEGQRFLDADFGYLPSAGTAIIGDFVWYDADSDGFQDPGEVGIGGVDVTYICAGPDGFLGTPDDTTATTTTDSDGYYLFTGLPPGECFVFFDPTTLPAGYNTTPTNTGANSTYNVTLAAGDVITFLDWGFDGGVVGSIGDFVWFDLDADGMQDAGEPGIGGVTLNLIGPGPNMTFGDADDQVLATTTTNANGGYLFAGVVLGQNYQVVVTDIDGILAGLNRTSTLPGTLSPSLLTPDILTADFGYAPAAGTGAIGTTVWHDIDGDGFRDPGEPPIQGVTLEIWQDKDGSGTISAGDNLLRGAATDFNGEYELKSLPFGDYIVDLTDTAGVLTGFTKTSGTAGVDDNSQADPYALTLSSGSPNNFTADFGFEDAAGALVISGTVFDDADIDGVIDFVDGDGDGVYDPGETTLESVVQGATLSLFRVVGGQRFFIGQTTTDVNGFYQFTNLPTGTYEVTVKTTGTAVEGFLQTTQTATGGVEPAPLPDGGDAEDPQTGNSANNNFGFYDGGVTTTPVTLSYFNAVEKGGRTVFEWHTATEVGHIGFNLWVERDGQWQRVNSAIIPSSGADSIVRHKYAHRADLVGGERFMLEDLDVRGQSRYHGPFELGQPRGRPDLREEPIDWRWVGAEHAAKNARRHAAALAAKAGGSGVTMRVSEDGVYRVGFAELKALGLNVSGNKPRLSLRNRGIPVPVRIDTKGQFVEFVGKSIDTLYTKTNVYTLSVDPTGVVEIAADPTKPNPHGLAAGSYVEQRRTERDRHYSFASPTEDPWFDQQILAFSSPASSTFDLVTDGRVAGAGPIHLTVGLWGATDFPEHGDHHVVVEVNGVALADETFDGIVDHPITLEIPEAVLSGAADTFRVVLPGDTGRPFDLVYLDHHVVSYPRAFAARDGALIFRAAGEVFEVSGLNSDDVVVYREDASQMTLLSGVKVTGTAGDYRARIPGSAQPATYHVASGGAIKSPALERSRNTPEGFTHGRADFLIVSHPDFIDGLGPLVDARRQQGWKVKVVDVNDVYAVYSGGVFDPLAIREYLEVAAANMKTEAVLLVGGDTYDYHDNLGLGGISFIPSLYGQTGEVIRFAPADGLYTDFDGDFVPELAIGRFPVRTSAELDVIVNRTLEFEEHSGRRSLVLAADDYDRPSRFDFSQASEQLAQLIPSDWQVHRAYIDELGVAGARAELLARINAGVAVTSFEGHSGPTTWSFDGLFSATDAESLTNVGLPTVVAQWGCWTTYYVSPANETLAHKLLLSGDRGAAAVLGATTLTEARSERALSLGVFRRLFQPGATVGQVILEAKRELAAQGHPAMIDVLIGWNLLGDPTLSGFGSVHER